jgi:hypothetical protein
VEGFVRRGSAFRFFGSWLAGLQHDCQLQILRLGPMELAFGPRKSVADCRKRMDGADNTDMIDYMILQEKKGIHVILRV